MAAEAVSGSFDTSAIRWSLTRNVAEQVMRFHDNAVNAVAWLKDGRIVTAGADARIAIWTQGKPEPDHVLDGHSGPIAGLAVSGDGKWLASASWDHSVRLWPLGGGAPRVLEGNAQNVNGVAFSPDGRDLVSAGYDASLRIWRLSDGGVSVHNLPTPLNSRGRSRPMARSSRPAPTARSISCRRRASCAANCRRRRRRSSRSRFRPTANWSPPPASAARWR